MRARALFLAACAAALSCGKSSGGGAGESAGKWTVLLYMAADNNLESAAKYNLESLARVGSGDGVTFLAQVDRSQKNAGAGYTGDKFLNLDPWWGTKRLRVDPPDDDHPNGSLKELADLANTVNMASAQALREFISWGAQTAPAQRYALVLWDHGGGWRAYGLDESYHNDSFDLGRLRDALRDGVAALPQPKIDLLGFDACLMATAETAVELSPFAGALVFSEEKEPAHGWDYAQLARDLRAAPDTHPLTVGAGIADAYFKLANTVNPAEGKNVTLSVVDGDKVPALAGAIDAFAAKLEALVQSQTDWQLVSQARAAAHEFGGDRNRSRRVNTVDLADLVALIGTTLGAIHDERIALEGALKAAVFHPVSGGDQTHASGLAIYFPPDAKSYDPSRAKWEQLDLAKTHWKDFLLSFYATGSGQTITPVVGDVSVTVATTGATGSSPIGTTAGTTAPLLASAELDVFQNVTQADGSQAVLGTFPVPASGYVDGKLTTTWSYDIYKLTDGAHEIEVPVFFDQVVASGDGTPAAYQFIVPATYQGPNDAQSTDVNILFLFDLASGKASYEGVFQPQPDGSLVSQIPLDPSSTLRAQWLYKDSSGNFNYVEQSDPRFSFSDADQPMLKHTVVYADTHFVLGFKVTDLAGNVSPLNVAPQPITVPCIASFTAQPRPTDLICPSDHPTCDVGSGTCR